jgi:transcriptional antiterminator RfaH
LYLQSRGIGTFLPVLTVNSTDGRATTDRPFFSCYLFAKMDFANVPLSSINWAPGVNRVVAFGGLPAVVPEEIVSWIRERLEQVDPRDYHRGRPLAPGDHLRVTKGPLKGLDVVFDQRLSSSARARVFVEILGRLTSCQMSLADLVAVEH